jgi:tryptophan-rich sensory protein
MADDARPITLPANLALYLLTPLVMNGIIFSLHWSPVASAPHPNPMLPPGWAVGAVWMLLYLAMGVARWLTRLISPPAARWIDALAILCLLYPLYTAGLSNDNSGLLGALLTAGFAAFVLTRLQRVSKLAALLTSLVLLWLLYASTALAFGLHNGYHS